MEELFPITFVLKLSVLQINDVALEAEAVKVTEDPLQTTGFDGVTVTLRTWLLTVNVTVFGSE